MIKLIEKDTRPVRCYICKKKMYYMGHPKYEPEYTLNDEHKEFKGYVHKECVEKRGRTSSRRITR